MEDFIRYFIYVHAFIGGFALASGSLSIVFKKGGVVHKKGGKLFVHSLVISAVMALFISNVPGHKNPFLFSIGIFSLYLTISGFRALRFKNYSVGIIDKIISSAMISCGLFMILLSFKSFWIEMPSKSGSNVNVVLLVFGLIGFMLALRDFVNFKNPQKLKKTYLILHLTKITGAYIATLTAFIVTNQIIPGIYGWITPTIVGTIFIVYWARKMSPK